MIVVSLVDDRLEESPRHRYDARSARAGDVAASRADETAVPAFDE
jgi:hypothetical protein